MIAVELVIVLLAIFLGARLGGYWYRFCRRNWCSGIGDHWCQTRQYPV